MTESPSESRLLDHDHPHLVPQIPIEIVSDEEMALLFARSLIPSTVTAFPSSVRSLQYCIALLSKRSLSGCSQPGIEDSGGFNTTTQKKKKKAESFLHRFRNKKGLSATYFADSEWCEKQTKYVLLNGNRVITKAMKTGRERHAKLEEEFVKKFKVVVNSDEDKWALRFLKFFTGINQLYTEGLTRELPLVGFAEGIWMVGVIDEVQMPATETQRNPLLVDTKTREKDKLPSEPQRRNGRFQLMFYKYLWDILEASRFPSDQFFDHFSLNPDCDLSEEIREVVLAKSGYPAKTLDDVVRYYRRSWILLPRAHDQLLFYISLEFWLGKREASYTPEEERWKCYCCEFASTCPAAPAKSVTCSNLPT
ncbi:exonuclease V, chloroplastic-like [Rosa sericea]